MPKSRLLEKETLLLLPKVSQKSDSKAIQGVTDVDTSSDIDDILLADESDDEIQIPKVVQNNDEVAATLTPSSKVDKRKLATKGNRSLRQIEAFNKVLEIKRQKTEERKKLKDAEKEEYQKDLEELVVKKAVSIKKKQLKKKAILESISDDEEPIESVMQKVKKIHSRPVQERQPVQPQSPMFNIRFC